MKSRDKKYRAAYWKQYRLMKMPYRVKRCAVCGNKFTKQSGESGNPKTCHQCRLSTCVQCRKPFKRNRLAAKFCSMLCKNASQEGREPSGFVSNRGRKPRTYHLTHRNKHGSAADREWRTAVFQRDKYTCQICWVVGGRLQADHIKPYSTHVHLRHILSNGRTLCVPCHRKTDTYGYKAAKIAAKRLTQEVLAL